MEQRISICDCGNGIIPVGFMVVVLPEKVVEDAMTNQPKPAPTAEEQPEFPPLDDTQKERDNSLAMMPDNPKAALYRAMCTCRERQLLAALVERDAALRSNREKDAQYQTLNDVVLAKCVQVKELYAELAEKDAKIAELKAECELAWGARHEWFAATGEANRKRYEVEAKLRAVSEILEDPYDHNAPWAKVARLRSIVDGKD